MTRDRAAHSPVIDVCPGTYRTRDGSRASVWQRVSETGTALGVPGEWKGTVAGGGITTWNADGTEAQGATEWDLMERVNSEATI